MLLFQGGSGGRRVRIWRRQSDNGAAQSELPTGAPHGTDISPPGGGGVWRGGGRTGSHDGLRAGRGAARANCTWARHPPGATRAERAGPGQTGSLSERGPEVHVREQGLTGSAPGCVSTSVMVIMLCGLQYVLVTSRTVVVWSSWPCLDGDLVLKSWVWCFPLPNVYTVALVQYLCRANTWQIINNTVDIISNYPVIQ